MDKVIKLPYYHIVVTLTPASRFRSGTIVSGLKAKEPHPNAPEDSGGDLINKQFDAAMDGIEAVILGHACAGMNIKSKAYVAGLQSAVEAVINNLT